MAQRPWYQYSTTDRRRQLAATDWRRRAEAGIFAWKNDDNADEDLGKFLPEYLRRTQRNPLNLTSETPKIPGRESFSDRQRKQRQQRPLDEGLLDLIAPGNQRRRPSESISQRPQTRLEAQEPTRTVLGTGQVQPRRTMRDTFAGRGDPSAQTRQIVEVERLATRLAPIVQEAFTNGPESLIERAAQAREAGDERTAREIDIVSAISQQPQIDLLPTTPERAFERSLEYAIEGDPGFNIAPELLKQLGIWGQIIDTPRSALAGAVAAVPETVEQRKPSLLVEGAGAGIRPDTREAFAGRNYVGIRDLPGPLREGAGLAAETLGDPLDVATGGALVGADLFRAPGRVLNRGLRETASQAVTRNVDDAAVGAGEQILRSDAYPRPSMVPIGGADEAVRGSPVERLVRVVRESKPVREATEKARTEIRAKQAQQMARVQRQIGGEESFFAARRIQQGELPSADITPGPTSLVGTPDEFTGADIDELMNIIIRNEPDVFKRTNAQQAVRNLLLKDKVPTRSERALLERIYGREFGEVLDFAAKESPDRWREALDSLGIPRAILSSVDFSAPMRQGALQIGRKEWWQSWGPMMRAFFSEEYAQDLDDALRGIGRAIDDPAKIRAVRREQYGLDLTRFGARTGTLTELEEAFSTTIPERVPFLRRIWNESIGRSERAYVTFLNHLRASTFDNTAERFIKAADNGLIDEARLGRSLDDLASWGNIATGRANLSPKIARDSVIVTANRIFFSPQLWVSRVKALGKGAKAVPLAVGEQAVQSVKQGTLRPTIAPSVRREIARDWLSFVGAGSSALAVGQMFGWWDVNLNPNSSNFGKGRVGNTRYDPWGGFQQNIRYTSQFLQALASGQGDRSKELPLRFIRSKLDPAVAMVVDIETGETFVGDQIDLNFKDVSELVGERFVPLSVQDFIEGAQDEGLIGGIKTLPAQIGVGVGTYEDSPFQEAQGLTNGEFQNMSRTQREQFLSDKPELAERLEKHQQQQAERGNEGAIRAENADTVRGELEQQQLNDDQLLTSGQIDIIEWRNRERSRNDERRNRLAGIYMDLGDGLNNPIENPENAAQEWLNEIIASTDASGQVDWDAVDLWLEKQTDAFRAELDELTGVGGTELQQRKRQIVRQLSGTGFFDVRDKAWNDFKQGVPLLDGFDSWEQFRMAQIRNLVGPGVDPTSQEWFEMGKRFDSQFSPIRDAWNDLLNRAEQAWIFDGNEELARIAAQWGYFNPTQSQAVTSGLNVPISQRSTSILKRRSGSGSGSRRKILSR